MANEQLPAEQSVVPHDGSASNINAYRIGDVVIQASRAPHGDYIDVGLIFVRRLHELGFSIVKRDETLPCGHHVLDTGTYFREHCGCLRKTI